MRLGDVKSWGYQLQAFSLEKATASPFDMLVLDPDATWASLSKLRGRPPAGSGSLHDFLAPGYESRTGDVDGLHPVMQERLLAFLTAAKAAGHEIFCLSGFRSAERQAVLWEQALAKYGSAAAARKYVAPPGKSTHQTGEAVDLQFGDRAPGLGGTTTAAVEWAHNEAAGFGLTFPLDYEDWHIETPEARGSAEEREGHNYDEFQIKARTRLVLAYLSVGEAEDYRSYWLAEWSISPPSWLFGENPSWPGNYTVRFWLPDWKAEMYGSPNASLDRIIDAGFDGVYLDKCDVYQDIAAKRPAWRSLASHMVKFVTQLSAYAKRRKPGFLVVMQNAEELLRSAKVRSAIDGIAKEELWFGLEGSEQPNSEPDLALLDRLKKPVFVVEYLNNATKITSARALASRAGYVLYVADKDRKLASLGER